MPSCQKKSLNCTIAAEPGFFNWVAQFSDSAFNLLSSNCEETRGVIALNNLHVGAYANADVSYKVHRALAVGYVVTNVYLIVLGRRPAPTGWRGSGAVAWRWPQRPKSTAVMTPRDVVRRASGKRSDRNAN